MPNARVVSASHTQHSVDIDGIEYGSFATRDEARAYADLVNAGLTYAIEIHRGHAVLEVHQGMTLGWATKRALELRGTPDVVEVQMFRQGDPDDRFSFVGVHHSIDDHSVDEIA